MDFLDLGSGVFLQKGSNLIEDHKAIYQDYSHIRSDAVYATTDDGQEPFEISAEELAEIGIESLGWEADTTDETWQVYENGIALGKLLTKEKALQLIKIMASPGDDLYLTQPNI